MDAQHLHTSVVFQSAVRYNSSIALAVHPSYLSLSQVFVSGRSMRAHLKPTDLIITTLPVVTKDLLVSPRFTPYDFLSRCKFSNLTTRQPMVEFYLLTFPRFPLRKKEHKSYLGKNRIHFFRTSRWADYLVEFHLLTFPRFPLRKKEHKSYLGKNRTHDFRTSRCAGYLLLDHSGEYLTLLLMGLNVLAYQSHAVQRCHPVTVNACGHEGSSHLMISPRFSPIGFFFLSRCQVQHIMVEIFYLLLVSMTILVEIFYLLIVLITSLAFRKVKKLRLFALVGVRGYRLDHSGDESIAVIIPDPA